MTEPSPLASDPTPGDLLRLAFRLHPAGVMINAADPGDGPVALTVNSLISVSASPPTVAVSRTDQSASAQAIRHRYHPLSPTQGSGAGQPLRHQGGRPAWSGGGGGKPC